MFVCESISNHRCNPPCDQQICSSSPDSVRKPCLAVGKRHEYPHRGTNNVNLAKPLSLSPINRRSEAVCRTISISTVHFSYAYIGVPSAYILGFSSVLFFVFLFFVPILFRSIDQRPIGLPSMPSFPVEKRSSRIGTVGQYTHTSCAIPRSQARRSSAACFLRLMSDLCPM